MAYILTTERLCLREMGQQDADDLFEMDSDPAVHKYIDNKPLQSKEQVVAYIDFVNKQYIENGIGRWAVVDRQTNECLGWAGLKYFREPLNGHRDIYELGYRFKQKHCGKGYASEASRALVDYGFATFDIQSIYAMTHPEHEGSMHVLRKLGFVLVEQFDYMGEVTNWFELKKPTQA